MAALVLENKHLVEPLMEIAFDVDNPISNKACWVMEFTAKENLSYIFPHLDNFTSNLGNVHFDSSVRPMAKICEYLMKAYFSSTENESQQVLTEQHLETIATVCFDWLIGNHRVAAKAYSMTCLLFWVKSMNGYILN